MYVIKEGNPVIFVDFSPELPNFQSCARPAKRNIC